MERRLLQIYLKQYRPLRSITDEDIDHYYNHGFVKLSKEEIDKMNKDKEDKKNE